MYPRILQISVAPERAYVPANCWFTRAEQFGAVGGVRDREARRQADDEFARRCHTPPSCSVSERVRSGRFRNRKGKTVEQFLQIAGAVAAVELLMRGWREVRGARRIVSIAGLNADLIVRNGCVPVQFAGSKYRSVGAFVAVLGFLFVVPNTRKHAFWVNSAMAIRDGREIAYSEIRAGDKLRVVLDGGERPKAFTRSLKRGNSGGYRMIAIREFADAGVPRYAHCITVRTRGMYAPTRVDGRVPQWLQYDVVAAAPRSRFQNGELALADVPDDAVHLVLTPTHADQHSESSTPRVGAIRRLLLRRNVNPWLAFLHIITKYGVLYVILWASGPVSGVPAVAALVGFAGLVVSLAFWRSIWRKMQQEPLQRPQPRTAETERIVATSLEWRPTHLVNTAPPKLWTGATSHCLSVGRVLNGTDAKTILGHRWHRFSYVFAGIRRAYVRFKER